MDEQIIKQAILKLALAIEKLGVAVGRDAREQASVEADVTPNIQAVRKLLDSS